MCVALGLVKPGADFLYQKSIYSVIFLKNGSDPALFHYAGQADPCFATSGRQSDDLKSLNKKHHGREVVDGVITFFKQNKAYYSLPVMNC